MADRRNPPNCTSSQCAARWSNLPEPGENLGVSAMPGRACRTQAVRSSLTRAPRRPTSTMVESASRPTFPSLPGTTRPMPSSHAFLLLAPATSRRVRKTWRACVHVVAMAAGLLATGILPTSVLAASSEVESTCEEAPSAVYGQHHNEQTSYSRRHSSTRYLKRGVALSTLPTLAGRLATSSASPALVSRLSLGLSVPMRC
jgi:hypothetical protein